MRLCSPQVSPNPRRVDGVDDLVQLARLERRHMQHRPEDLALDRADPVHRDDGRRHETPALGHGQRLDDPVALRVEIARIPSSASASITGPTSVSVSQGSPDMQRVHRARQRLEHALARLLLDVEHAQRRAALPGRLERRGQHVAHHLFRQSGTVHDRRVEPAGLRDQHRVRTGIGGQRPVDDPRHLGRSGEAHARDVGRSR